MSNSGISSSDISPCYKHQEKSIPRRDPFGRILNYLRISVTDRCNLRCFYCMPPEGLKLIKHEDILTFEEIAEFTRIAVPMGFTKLRITGGEPLVRKHLDELVMMLAAISGVRDLAMTTNGILLADHAKALSAAGLKRVNISLDTLDAERYREITGGGDINRVLSGIEAARDAGLVPIKLNCVVKDSSSEVDARMVARFARENQLEARFILQMDMPSGRFSNVDGGSGGDCVNCNRIRLSSEGKVRPCLFSDLGFNVRTLGMEKALEYAISQKPEAGGPCSHNWIHGIGG